jgi:hypothetical protein
VDRWYCAPREPKGAKKAVLKGIAIEIPRVTEQRDSRGRVLRPAQGDLDEEGTE